MTRKNIKIITSIALTAALAVSATGFAFADTTETTSLLTARGPQQMQGQMGGQMGGMTQNGTTGNASSPSEITTSTLASNSAESLTVDYANATTIVMSNENSNVKITEAGTYIVTGSCSNGNVTVKKGTTGVVLILKDLDLTSTVGAAVSLNKGSEVKVIVEGSVTLTDAEDIANEESSDYDGAALKAKAGSSVVLTGSGTLTVNGSCEHGIKVADLDEDDVAEGYSEASFIIDGENLTVNVTAAEDGINSGTDLTIKSGNITVSAGDDGIKADYILTIGEEGASGPNITINKSNEGLEGATVNIYSGTANVTSSDDAINAANSDLTGYTYSLNIMGGTVNISSGADGLDSNGNINITGGLTTIVKAASNGGEGGMDYNGSCYIAEGTLVNPFGTTMDSGNGGMMGQRGQMTGPFEQRGQQGESQDGTQQMPQFGQQDGTQQFPQFGQFGDRGQMNGEMPQFDGERPEMNGQFGQRGPRGEFGQNGEMPQPPQMNGEAPEDLPATENLTANSEQTSAETQQNPNWFVNLLNIIKGWFAK